MIEILIAFQGQFLPFLTNQKSGCLSNDVTMCGSWKRKRGSLEIGREELDTATQGTGFKKCTWPQEPRELRLTYCKETKGYPAENLLAHSVKRFSVALSIS